MTAPLLRPYRLEMTRRDGGGGLSACRASPREAGPLQGTRCAWRCHRVRRSVSGAGSAGRNSAR